MPNQKMNSCDRKRFHALIGLLNVGCEGSAYDVYFRIEKTYLDFGAGMEWETIIAHRNMPQYLDTYQILSPFQWDVLQIAGFDEVVLLAQQILKEQANLLGLK